MSLLNQVLQDLQERQAPDVNGAQTTLRDVRIPVRAAPRVARRPWVLWLAILVLAGVSGKLLWQLSQQDTATPIATRPSAAPTASVAVARPAAQQLATAGGQAVASAITPTPVEGAVTKANKPIATPTSPPAIPHAPTAVAQAQAPVATAAQPAPITAKNSTPPSTPPVVNPAVAPRRAAVEKTARPLSPEQHAELTYQDALRLLQSGRPSAAEPRLRAALDDYPAHRAARTALAGLLINSGRLPEATTLLAAGLAVAPTYAPFAKLYARLRIDQGELAEARAVLERAAPAAQDDPEYHALLAALYQRLGLYEQAAQTYRGALQAQPRNGVWWLGLGLALEGAGDKTNALQAYQRAQQSGTLDSDVLRYVDSKITALR